MINKRTGRYSIIAKWIIYVSSWNKEGRWIILFKSQAADQIKISKYYKKIGS